MKSFNSKIKNKDMKRVVICVDPGDRYQRVVPANRSVNFKLFNNHFILSHIFPEPPYYFPSK